MDMILGIHTKSLSICTIKYFYLAFPMMTDLIDPASSEDESSEAFDPCGSDSGATTTCDEDWDRDGVYDSEEPKPETLLSQIRVMQCTLAGNDVSGMVPMTYEIIDYDEQDEDDNFTYDRIQNSGRQVRGRRRRCIY